MYGVKKELMDKTRRSEVTVILEYYWKFSYFSHWDKSYKRLII